MKLFKIISAANVKKSASNYVILAWTEIVWILPKIFKNKASVAHVGTVSGGDNNRT